MESIILTRSPFPPLSMFQQFLNHQISDQGEERRHVPALSALAGGGGCRGGAAGLPGLRSARVPRQAGMQLGLRVPGKNKYSF